MMSEVEFALLLIYLAIGIATTISLDALAIALIDEDVYGLPDSAPSSSGWESLLWKSFAVVVSPLVLATCMGIRGVLWMGKKKNWDLLIHLSSPQPQLQNLKSKI